MGFGLLLLLSNCGSSTTDLVVYSPHGQDLEHDIQTRFEKAYPAYALKFIDMPGARILPRIEAEKERPGADVWWGGSPGDFMRAESEGLLEKYVPEWIGSLPDGAKSPNGGWTACFRTPEIIMYNSKKINASEVPATWDGLLDAKWKGRIAVRDVRGSATMRTIFGALILREKQRSGNVEAGFEWLRKLDKNTGSYAATAQILTDLLESDGPCALTLWNLADAPLLKSQGHPFEYVIPDQTPVPFEPIALVKGSSNSAGAKLFYEFVNSPAQLELMAKERFRLPARTDISSEHLPAWMRELKIDPLQVDWIEFNKHVDEWVEKWDREIKGKSQ